MGEFDRRICLIFSKTSLSFSVNVIFNFVFEESIYPSAYINPNTHAFSSVSILLKTSSFIVYILGGCGFFILIPNYFKKLLTVLGSTL